MKRIIIQTAFTAVTALFSLIHVCAQTNQPRYEFGLNLGFTVYQGDLTPKRLGSFETQKFSLGFHASRLFSPSFSARANLLFGKLKGDESVYENPEYRQQRNFKFISPVTELSVQAVWNVLGRNYVQKGFSPYVFAGGGFAFLNVKPDWSNINTTYFPKESAEVWTGLAADSTHALPGVIPVIPLGVGVKYFFTPRLAINAESSYRLSYTDYIDGFSQAANPEKKDHYLNYSIGIIFRTGNKDKLKCAKMKY
jgi:hypothetical protein